MPTVTDDFNRADGAVGAAWTMVPTGDGTPTWSIVSNKVRNTTTGGSFGKYARHDTAVGSDDMYAQAVITSTQTNASSNSGVLCRGQTGSTNSSYQFTGRHAGDTLALWRILTGTETQLRMGCNASGSTGAAQTLSRAWSSGDTLRIEAVGSLLRGKHNGTLVFVTRDTSTLTGQRGGLNCYNTTAGDFDESDDFRAGPIDDLLAPYVSAVAAQVTGTGTTLTPAALDGLATGDIMCVQATGRDAAQTVTAPAGEGWSLIQNPSQTDLEAWVFAKRWGLGGQTDDTTPTFTIGSGTSGWGLTAFAVRNPAHATNPWNSVADAIVASGQQSNAAAANATAPSVTDTGSHRTIVRLFSSADDNALGLSSTAPSHSEGALVYGGVDYDSTTGNDFAQAMTILEDTTTAGSTGTATAAETAVGNDISNGVTLVFAIPSGVALAGHADASDAAFGAATVERNLSGHGDAATLAFGAATVERNLAGHGDAAATAFGAATVAKNLAGHADTASTAFGALDTPRNLAGHADAASAAFGLIDVGGSVDLAGHADSASAAFGTLSVGRALAGHADAAAIARGQLTEPPEDAASCNRLPVPNRCRPVRLVIGEVPWYVTCDSQDVEDTADLNLACD